MNAPHSMTPQERKEAVLDRLDNALYLARMHEDLAHGYRHETVKSAVHTETAKGWRKEAARLKCLPILAEPQRTAQSIQL